MAGGALSRRFSEFIGVVLFALALLWIVALASYSTSDPVWFFNTGAGGPPDNFAGRVGAFMAELSYQIFGYSAYLIPVVMIVAGWHYFWCKAMDARYTKAIGAGLLFACVSSFFAMIFGAIEIEGKEFRTGGYLGQFLAGILSDYLNTTGSVILILTTLCLATILATQFSLGRLFGVLGEILRDRWAAALGGVRTWREERRRERQRQ